MELNKEQIAEWAMHPISKALVNILQEHSKANKEAIYEHILNKTAENAASCLPTLLQLKGQIHVLDAVANIKEFLLDASEQQGGEKDAIQGNGP